MFLAPRLSCLRLGVLPLKWLQSPSRRFHEKNHSFSVDSNLNLLEKLHNEGMYRPVGAFIVQDLLGRCLVTRSVKVEVWSFPQGGIDRGETLEENMRRELEEEVGLQSKDLSQLVTGLYVGRVDFPPGRTERRGFAKGKAYFFGYARVETPVDLIIQETEVAEAMWVDRSSLLPLLRDCNSPDKYSLLEEASNKVLTEYGVAA